MGKESLYLDWLMDDEALYLAWLTENFCKCKDAKYTRLLQKFWEKEFYSLIPHDEDRGKDGLAYREKWSAETGLESDFGCPRVLEVLIGLSERIHSQLWGGQYADKWSRTDIFWKLVGNLKVLQYDDSYLGGISEPVGNMLENWLERKYSKDGTGGIFVVKDVEKNFKKLNLWDQMQIFVREAWPL